MIFHVFFVSFFWFSAFLIAQNVSLLRCIGHRCWWCVVAPGWPKYWAWSPPRTSSAIPSSSRHDLGRMCSRWFSNGPPWRGPWSPSAARRYGRGPTASPAPSPPSRPLCRPPPSAESARAVFPVADGTRWSSCLESGRKDGPVGAAWNPTRAVKGEKLQKKFHRQILFHSDPLNFLRRLAEAKF